MACRDEPALAIRAERDTDRATIADVVRRAYAAVPHSDHREHLMVERLRATSAFVPELSLIAECGAAAVGHVLLVALTMRGMASPPRLLVLAPLSVVPEHQGRRVGAALVRAAHERAGRLGFAAIVVIGMPGYYVRFGYRPLAETRLMLPFAVPEVQRLIHVLAPARLPRCEGVIAFPEAWITH